MQLYTVVLETKHLISTFNEKGQKIGQRTETIRQTICDLPHSTAMMYRTKDAASVTVTKQDMSDFGRGDGRRDIAQRSQKRSAAPITTTKKAPAARPAQQTSVQQAAATGNMTAAINAAGGDHGPQS
ncbi:hypothetical protein [Shinella zoogloeoides]|uniref:hypothetical protein n=1 Tax=Shinella zoogloeoides TaxID=352475 RepID=UPI00273E4C30|nr:hypothetical protein [Shinella zoogloeoides]WLR90882.1 hypothetical protein Q9316_00465 [Shinella zoogloeoides]